MRYSLVQNVCALALSTTVSVVFAKGQDTQGLIQRDEKAWQDFGTIDPWYLPDDVAPGGDKDGSVLLKNGGSRVRCGVVPYDLENGNVWMISANRDFEKVGYILPRGGYDDRSDKTLADCVLRESKEEGGFIIDIKSLIPLGLSNGGSVYWYTGNIIKMVDPVEPRAHPPKSFKLNEARKELLKPEDTPKKKADMRQAFDKSTSADKSASYGETFKERSSPEESDGANSYSYKDAGPATLVYSPSFKGGREPIVRIEVDSLLNKIVADKAEDDPRKTPDQQGLGQLMAETWQKKGLSLQRLNSIELTRIVDGLTNAAIAAVRTNLELFAQDFHLENQPEDSYGWNQLISSPLGNEAQMLATAAGKSISKISVYHDEAPTIGFVLA
ncbi:hypothetical protein LZ30DRAFT_820215 [Colletotrichum cereale]|nr:hypothetical protein LZ30DRAFT_820215 [Colletotrichum cereale]